MKVRLYLFHVASQLVLLSSLSALTDWKPNHDDPKVDELWVSAIEEALPRKPIVQPAEARKILVFSATAGFRHSSIPVGKIALEKLGQFTGAFSAVISDDPANFEKNVLSTFDAVVLLNPTQDFFMPSKKKRGDFSDEEWDWLQARHDRLVDNLVEFAIEGGGIMGIHAATDACYSHESYGEAIGGYFDGHPWSWMTDVTIVVEDPDHATMQPVFGEMIDFSFREEIYQFRNDSFSRDRVRVLLHLDPKRSGKVNPKKIKRTDNDFPVAWVRQVGAGRVFYTSIGHNEHVFMNPLMLKHYLAGIQFAIGDLEADTTPSNALK